MADPFVAEIRIFPFNFAPTGWALCNGQLMPISQNTALFSLLGTTYGGDGRTTFALPNLQGMAPLQQGQGPGLSLYDLGQAAGTDSVTLLTSEMPSHSHSVGVNSNPGNLQSPASNLILGRSQRANAYQDNTTQNLVTMNANALSVAGGSLPHNNLMPYLTVNFCVALQGIFPPRG